jgi:CheY-like chemotaxis protein
MPKRRILIVDDEPDIAEVMGDRLAANGYDVQIVASARACYAAIGERRPDLVLLDIQMPEISGMEALVELKASHPDLPVLMVSASTVQAAAAEARRKGAEGFLLKPYEPADLMRWVTNILGPNHE